ncbi:MAG: anti-sigma factor antagonist [Calditrichales bacterium]|nr:MAG: anti-sigma factor antagonist [Calditrichales bacterium]
MSFDTYMDTSGIQVIDCPPRLDVNVSDQLKVIMAEIIDSGKHKIVINLTKTRYMDSSGLGAVVSRIAVTRANQGDIRIATKMKAIVDLLDITHLNKILKRYDSVENAIASFS